MTCIPNGVKVPVMWPRQPEQSEQTTRAIYVGRIEHEQKGVLYLPEVMERINDHVKMDLDIVGDGPDRNALQSAFRARGLDGQCHFHGALSHDAALAVLAKSHLLLMPSHYEGLPLALLEGMAWGVVPIVFRLDGCTDYVLGDQSGGILVSPEHPAEMASAAVALARSPEKLRAMSQVAWRTALDRFAFEKTGEAYLRVICECRRRRQSAGAPIRSGRLDEALLGDLPSVPVLLKRPVRRACRAYHRLRSVVGHG